MLEEDSIIQIPIFSQGCVIDFPEQQLCLTLGFSQIGLLFLQSLVQSNMTFGLISCKYYYFANILL